MNLPLIKYYIHIKIKSTFNKQSVIHIKYKIYNIFLKIIVSFKKKITSPLLLSSICVSREGDRETSVVCFAVCVSLVSLSAVCVTEDGRRAENYCIISIY